MRQVLWRRPSDEPVPRSGCLGTALAYHGRKSAYAIDYCRLRIKDCSSDRNLSTLTSDRYIALSPLITVTMAQNGTHDDVVIASYPDLNGKVVFRKLVFSSKQKRDHTDLG